MVSNIGNASCQPRTMRASCGYFLACSEMVGMSLYARATSAISASTIVVRTKI